MIVDMLLKLLGENPEQYTQSIDKWIAVETIITDNIFVVLPYVLFVFSWLWIIRDKRRGKIIAKTRIAKVFLISIVLFMIGLSIPVMYDYLIAILGIRSYYGM